MTITTMRLQREENSKQMAICYSILVYIEYQALLKSRYEGEKVEILLTSVHMIVTESNERVDKSLVGAKSETVCTPKVLERDS